MKYIKFTFIRYLVIIFLVSSLFPIQTNAQIWKKIKEAVKETAVEIAKETAEVLKDSAIIRVQKWAEDYDPTELNYAVSFSDNSGFYESEDKFEKYKRSLIGFAVSEGTVTDKLSNKIQNVSAEDFNHAGELFYVSNHFKPAERSFETALTILTNQGKSGSETEALVKSNLGLLYHTTGRFTLSKKYTLEALKLRRNALNSPQGLGASFNNLGVLNKDLGKYNQAAENFKEALAITGKEAGEKSSEYAIILNNIAILN